MDESIIYQNKAMLNLPGHHGVAALSIHLAMDTIHNYVEEDSKEYKPSIEGNLAISDCNRAINLDLYISSKEDYTNTLFKLKTLATIIEEAHVELIARQNSFNERWDRVDAREKQERLDKKNKVKK